MAKDYKKNKLKKYFDFQKNNFFDPVDLKDAHDGFTTMKKIGPKGHFSYFRIFITEKNFGIENNKKPLTIHATNGRLDEDKKLVVASSNWKRPFFGPIDLTSENEFFFDNETEEFFKKNREIDPQQILEYIEKLHIKPTKPIIGIWLRIKLIFWQILARDTLKLFNCLLIFLLKISTGKEYTYNITSVSQFENSLKEEREKDENDKEGKKLNIFGYKIPAIRFLPYSAFHLFFYFLFWHFDYKPKIVTAIFGNNFLTIMYTLFTLIIFESFLNGISGKRLEKIIKKISILYSKLWSKKIKL